VTESASPEDWDDATARTYADEIRLALHGARVERIDPPKEELAARCSVSRRRSAKRWACERGSLPHARRLAARI
jgi:hypothetical protein